MLEDTSYQHVVRWSEMGDSFIVLDVCFLGYFVDPDYRTTNSQKMYCLDISSIPTLRVLYGN